MMSKLRFIVLILLVFLDLACQSSIGNKATAIPLPTIETLPTVNTYHVIEPTFTATNVITYATPAPLDEPLPFKAVVQIWTLDSNDERIWSGSGTIISADGYALTNAHVVLSDQFYEVDSLLISVTVAEDKLPVPMYIAEIVVIDEYLDLAVLRFTKDMAGNQIEYETLNLPFVKLGDSDEVTLGTLIRILGYPSIGGETITLTTGEVGGFTSEAGIEGRAYLKTTATIVGGNSGGLGLNYKGEMIGIPTQLGYGGDDNIVDCRILADTNQDGQVNEDDVCVSTGGFINALRPINLAKPLIARAMHIPNATPTPPDYLASSFNESNPDILFYDDFTINKGIWQSHDQAKLVDGKFTLSLNATNDWTWTTIEHIFRNGSYHIDISKIDGQIDNSFGQIFRFQDKQNFYSFEISSDGLYAINKCEMGIWHALIDWKSSSLINTITYRNQITTMMNEDTFTFSINGTEIDTLYDSTFSQGRIGMIISSYSEPQVTIGFDNILVQP
ncbi:MAG: hypothetical protein B6242_16590 [Anaerolineaceae bacterium 4572_78]|nr:MAG: hypothetical protein B6242_16590 [Anaerolineaceae bacterium 4572_78]